MKFADFEKVLGKPPVKPFEGQVAHLTTDSRQIREAGSTVFVALKGPMRDGHDFVRDAYNQGVRQFIVEKVPDPALDAGFFQVESSLAALQQISTHHRSRFTYPIVAITGSNGKTIVKEWLASMVGQSFHAVKSPKSYNSQIGVPLSLLEMTGGHDLGIFEAGISQVGEMKRLQEIIKPSIGIFTNIGEAHAQGFPSKEVKAAEKASLFKRAEKVICRYEHTLVRHQLEALNGPQVVTWSTESSDATIYYDLSDQQVDVHHQDRVLSLGLPFDQEPFLENLLHSITASLVLEVDAEVISKSILTLPRVDMRLAIKKARNHCYLIDDSYSNDLIGLKAALETQQAQRTENLSKTVILSDLLETGLAKRALYQQIKELLHGHQVSRFIGIGFDPDLWMTEGPKMDVSLFSSTEEFLQQPPKFEAELILIKGARVFGFERIVSHLQHQSHRTQLSISFEKLRNNLAAFKGLVRPQTKIMVMVKAFAYGGGSYEIANFLQYQGTDYLGVAYFDEGRQLREQGIRTPIMVMNPDPGSLSSFSKYRLEPVIYSSQLLENLLNLAEVPYIHLEVETGMNRLGFSSKQLPSFLNLSKQIPKGRVKSIFTHLATADDPNESQFTANQLSHFEELYKSIVAILGYRPLKHALNTAGIITQPDHHYDMVRLGIGLYGMDPVGKIPLESISTFSTYISQIKEIKAGETVGYSRKGVVSRDSRIATLPVGYADGYLRTFGNGNAKVLIGKELVPTIGNICMDMTMVDITDCEASEGDEAILMGTVPHITDLARWAGTIPYEILTNISSRVERVYSWL